MAFKVNNFALYSTGPSAEHQVFHYVTLDPIATVTAANYFVNAKNLGVRIGDEVIIKVIDAFPVAGPSPQAVPLELTSPAAVVAVGRRVFDAFDAAGNGTANMTLA